MYKVVLILGLAAVLSVSACSRQQSDWEKTRAANTTEAYELFLKKYPSGEFTSQAQARVKELYEERDWQKARDIDSAEAYQAFVKQYPDGKWAEEARIRIENFTLASAPSNTVPPGSSASNVASSEPDAASPSAQPTPSPRPTASPRPAPSLHATPPESATPPVQKSRKQPVKAAVASTAKPASPGSADYSVQLGAFKSGEGAANKRWAHLASAYPKVLAGLSPQVTTRQDGSGTMYRLQVKNLSDKRAHSLCKDLKSHSQDCIVLSPVHAG